MCLGGKPKTPRPVWSVGESATPIVKMAGWLRKRLAAGSPTDLNPSVTLNQGPPSGSMP